LIGPSREPRNRWRHSLRRRPGIVGDHPDVVHAGISRSRSAASRKRGCDLQLVVGNRRDHRRRAGVAGRLKCVGLPKWRRDPFSAARSTTGWRAAPPRRHGFAAGPRGRGRRREQKAQGSLVQLFHDDRPPRMTAVFVLFAPRRGPWTIVGAKANAAQACACRVAPQIRRAPPFLVPDQQPAANHRMALISGSRQSRSRRCRRTRANRQTAGAHHGTAEPVTPIAISPIMATMSAIGSAPASR